MVLPAACGPMVLPCAALLVGAAVVVKKDLVTGSPASSPDTFLTSPEMADDTSDWEQIHSSGETLPNHQALESQGEDPGEDDRAYENTTGYHWTPTESLNEEPHHIYAFMGKANHWEIKYLSQSIPQYLAGRSHLTETQCQRLIHNVERELNSSRGTASGEITHGQLTYLLFNGHSEKEVIDDPPLWDIRTNPTEFTAPDLAPVSIRMVDLSDFARNHFIQQGPDFVIKQVAHSCIYDQPH